MLLAHKIALGPDMAQREYFARAACTARFVYNWALAEWQRQYKAGEKPNDTALRRQLNAIKRTQYPWMFEVTKCAAQEAIIDLGSAFRAFFEKRGRYPRFKRKDDRPSFCAANEAGTFCTDGERIKLPIIGWVRMREAVRFSGPLKRATVSFEDGRWFVSLMIETNDAQPVQQPVDFVGVDEAGRDVNAALAASSFVTACREARSGAARKSRVKRASVKQEEKTAVLEAA